MREVSILDQTRPNTTAISNFHFHIHWLRSDKLDWERHDTRTDAEESASRLAQNGEEYSVEQFNGDCQKCRLDR
jgi:hypothetical protein